MRALLLRLDAPLMSFGGPLVDNYGVIQEFPGLSMLVGLIGNALGLEHHQADELNRLQERTRYVVCCERAGTKIRDFQTVDFSRGTDDLKVAKTVGWTTHGRVEHRAGSPDTIREKHIRYRDYWADACYLIALTLEPADEEPSVETVARALREPARPLFIGRKTCLPSTPLLVGSMQTETLMAAILSSVVVRTDTSSELSVWWEEGIEPNDRRQSVAVMATDERNWRTQMHGGQRVLRRSVIQLESKGTSNERG